ncbi:MAG TPA: cysteine desulfurase NifS [Candidatus Dojkabacteria bacterium]|nr:cysteine desulfurase NifS [Candidatus Dojkabacteria bacterium]
MYYFDNAATTKIRPEVLNQMMPFLTDEYGNASSIYTLGRTSKNAIETARKRVADAIGADADEIYFTSSGTEADNWALKGVASANSSKGKHIIVSSIEHHAILKPCEYLKKHGFDISYIPVTHDGIIDIKELKESIRSDTVLISVMYANNEIGTIQPIEDIAKLAKEKSIYFHTDAVQAVGHIPIDVKKLGIDLLTISAHKLNGPKGVGALYIKKGTKIDQFMHGGDQEMKRRAGTENTAGIVGFGKAIQLAVTDIEKKNEYIKRLRDTAIEGILSNIPDTFLNGDASKRLPGNANICFKYVEGESILLHLDRLGICASTGSACTSASLEPSHVLLAIGISPELAHGSLRLTFSEENTIDEVKYLIKVLPDIIAKLRQMSPLYNNLKDN